jgi:hypothetical protein
MQSDGSRSLPGARHEAVSFERTYHAYDSVARRAFLYGLKDLLPGVVDFAPPSSMMASSPEERCYWNQAIDRSLALIGGDEPQSRQQD